MRTLYLHGLGSAGITPEKRTVLENFDLEVEAPRIDYRHTNTEFFDDLVRNIKPELLVGSSMGGRISYWLSNKYQLPAILFNPAIGLNICETIVPIEHFEHENKFPKQLFIFGEHDRTVQMKEVVDFIGADIHCLVVEGMSHTVKPEDIDFAVFYYLNNF